jgi:hypothetical protein
MSAPLEFALLHARQQDKSRVMPVILLQLSLMFCYYLPTPGLIGRLLKNRPSTVS